MPLQITQYFGPLDLPTPPRHQQSASLETRDPDILALFNAPRKYLVKPYEDVRDQWRVRRAHLRHVHQVLTSDLEQLEVLPEDVVTAAAVLKWMAGFEEWLRKSFLHVVFTDPSDPTEAAQWMDAAMYPDHVDLILQFEELWDKIFDTMRKFLINIHYTNTLDLTGDTLRPYTDYEVYIKPTQLLITPRDKEYCIAMSPNEHKRLCWDHRRIILERGNAKREGVAWLLQDREEIEELARRYPDAEATLRKPFMMPAIQFR